MIRLIWAKSLHPIVPRKSSQCLGRLRLASCTDSGKCRAAGSQESRHDTEECCRKCSSRTEHSYTCPKSICGELLRAISSRRLVSGHHEQPKDLQESYIGSVKLLSAYPPTPVYCLWFWRMHSPWICGDLKNGVLADCLLQVRFFYSFTCRDNLYLVMEYLNGGDLYSMLRTLGCLEEDMARVYIAELVS